MHSKEQSRSRLSDGTKQGALRVAFAVGVLALLAVMLLILSVFQARRPVSSLKQNGFLPGSGKATVYAAAGNGLAAAEKPLPSIRSVSPSLCAQEALPSACFMTTAELGSTPSTPTEPTASPIPRAA